MPVPSLVAWKEGKRKNKKQLAPNEDPFFGKTTAEINEYNKAYIELNGELADPTDEPINHPVDERAVVLAGGGKPHGRLRILNSMLVPTTSITRL